MQDVSVGVTGCTCINKRTHCSLHVPASFAQPARLDGSAASRGQDFQGPLWPFKRALTYTTHSDKRRFQINNVKQESCTGSVFQSKIQKDVNAYITWSCMAGKPNLNMMAKVPLLQDTSEPSISMGAVGLSLGGGCWRVPTSISLQGTWPSAVLDETFSVVMSPIQEH